MFLRHRLATASANPNSNLTLTLTLILILVKYATVNGSMFLMAVANNFWLYYSFS